jgi:hypothetical protein
MHKKEEGQRTGEKMMNDRGGKRYNITIGRSKCLINFIINFESHITPVEVSAHGGMG